MDKTKASVEEKNVIAKMCTSDDLGAEKKCSLESDYSCGDSRVDVKGRSSSSGRTLCVDRSGSVDK